MNGNNQDYLEGLDYPHYKFATFWQRVWATLVDVLVLSPIFVLIFVNNAYWKSLPLIIFLNVITLVYKPLLEYKFGATVGKMAIKLSILNYEYQKIQLNNSLLRNIFDILPGIYSIILAFLIYQLPEFQTAISISEYDNISNRFINSTWYSVITTLIYIADIAFLFSDSKKRTLHDKIGQTIVVQQYKNGA